MRFIEKSIGWIAMMFVLFALLKVGGNPLMWTFVFLVFVGKVLWEMRKIKKQRERDGQ